MVEGFRLQVFRVLQEIAVNECDFLHHSVLLNIFLRLLAGIILNFNGGHLECWFSLNQQQGNDAATGADIQHRLAG